MPAETRDQRRAQRIENARRWGQWLTTAMAQEGIEPKDIINGSDGTIDKGTVSHWMLGDYGASPENTLIVARVLRRPPVEALRAAGHDTVADAISSAADIPGIEALIAEARKILDPLPEDQRDQYTQDLLRQIRETGRRMRHVNTRSNTGNEGENGGQNAS